MDAASCAVADTNAAAENPPQRKSPFDHILHALLQVQVRRARTMIAKYAHLLPEDRDAADVMRFVGTDRTHSG